jgi:hypothetical protein
MDWTSSIICLTCLIHHVQSTVNEVPVSLFKSTSSPHYTQQNAFIFRVKQSQKITRLWRWHLTMSGIIHPMTECHIPGDLNLQQHHCENLQSCTSLIYLKAFETIWSMHIITHKKNFDVNTFLPWYKNSIWSCDFYYQTTYLTSSLLHESHLACSHSMEVFRCFSLQSSTAASALMLLGP